MTDTHRIPESLLAHIWKGQWILKGPLTASDGRMIQVRSQGVENKDSGPDFFNATIIFDDEIVTGDVELHIKSSDWRAHGHQHDPHFNNTILHVVLRDDIKTPATLHNGESIPTLSLDSYLNGSMDDMAVRAEKNQKPSLPCRDTGDKSSGNVLLDLIKQFGFERFYVKSALFEVALVLDEPEQVLYRGVMGALGYRKNKKAFETLALQLPVNVIDSIVRENSSMERIQVIQALLMGAAGLLPSQSDSRKKPPNIAKINLLEETWHLLEIETMMKYSDWHFFRMHPSNFPTSRLMAASYLLDRYLDHGMNKQITDIVKKTGAGRPSTAIEQTLMVPHFLGKERAREIVINIILPFSLALAQRQMDMDLKEHVLQLYASYPKSGENQITRYLSEVLWSGDQYKHFHSAQIQQGLIHIYKTFCMEQRCQNCHIITSTL